jgi:hypothetical protein
MMLQAVCTAAQAMAARWLSGCALAFLIAGRTASLSARRGRAGGAASAGGLPLVGQQLLDTTVQLCRHSGEHILQVGPWIMAAKLGRLPGKWLHIHGATVGALRTWLDAASIEDGFILRGVINGGVLTTELGEGQIPRIYKRLARKAGLTEQVVKRISGHSLRVGGAQDLLIQGASLPQILVKGGWLKTDTVIRYVERVRPTQIL